MEGLTKDITGSLSRIINKGMLLAYTHGWTSNLWGPQGSGYKPSSDDYAQAELYHLEKGEK